MEYGNLSIMNFPRYILVICVILYWKQKKKKIK